jgi:hypothetical protein
MSTYTLWSVPFGPSSKPEHINQATESASLQVELSNGASVKQNCCVFDLEYLGLDQDIATKLQNLWRQAIN